MTNQRYLEDLKQYLESFIARAKPLYNFIELKQQIVQDFNEKWAQGAVKGWELSEETKEDALYCRACDKLFSNSSVFESHKTGKKHLKALEASSNPCTVDRKRRPVALNETLIKAYFEMLEQVREETRAFVDTKQVLTEKERMELLDGKEQLEVNLSDAENDQDDEKIYNPLKLPLGWDGKPIPFWLYKLHGLSVEYNCEICGNFTYMGRKAFDMHFTVSFSL